MARSREFEVSALAEESRGVIETSRRWGHVAVKLLPCCEGGGEPKCRGGGADEGKLIGEFNDEE